MSTVSVDVASREVDQARDHTSTRWVGAIGAFIVILGLLVVMLDSATRMNVKDLFVDPVAKGNLSAHVGVFSHLGVLALWSGATVLCGSVILTPRRNGSRFAAMLAGLLAWMALDDLYLVHEELGGVISRMFLPSVDRRLLEGIVFAAIGVAWIVLLICYRREILQGPVVLLIVALASLGASVGIDLGEIVITDWVDASEGRVTVVAVIEELFKLGGILVLTLYAGMVARDRLRRATLPG